MSETGNGGTIVLPAVADLPQAQGLKTQLEQTGGAATIDASQVQRVSSPFLQVLLAGAAAAAKNGAAMVIAEPSPEFLETVSVLGLKTALGLV